MTEDARDEYSSGAERTFALRKGEFAVLRTLAQWTIDETCAKGLPDSVCHDIDLALQEAVSNIIRHGIRDERDHTVAVSIAHTSAAVRVRTSDDAAAFDPLTAPPVPQAATLADARPGGRGILLLRAMTREMHYEFADGRNVLTLTFDRMARPA